VDFFAAYTYGKKCDNLFGCITYRLLDVYGVSDKSTAHSSVPTYFIGYFDIVNSDYFSERRELPAEILGKGLYFPVLLKWIFAINNATLYMRIPNAMQINNLLNFPPYCIVL